MRYIQRQSGLARSVHWLHTLATLALFITGILIYVPSIANAIALGTMEVARLVHRGGALIFLGIPILAMLIQPRAAAHKFKEYFKPWTAEDKEFMKKFLPYLFNPKKVHMPEQGKYKSGQILADGLVIVFALLIGISGAFLWAANSFSPELIRWMYLLHDVSMIMMGILLLGHIYLGAGIFKPYRGTGRLMFGDGKVSEADARYHWGKWADEEITSGEHVVKE